jgi:predicted nucleotidyltransferase
MVYSLDMLAGTNGIHLAIELPGDILAAFCSKWDLRTLEVFGSVLREDFRPDSDIDVLVTFDSSYRPTLFEFIAMQDELQEILGRKVDLLTRHSIEASRNPYRRRSILDSARVIYAK